MYVYAEGWDREVVISFSASVCSCVCGTWELGCTAVAAEFDSKSGARVCLSLGENSSQCQEQVTYAAFPSKH